MVKKPKRWNWQTWPWSSDDSGCEGSSGDSDDVKLLRSVIAELGKELKKARDDLQKRGVAVRSATATLAVDIRESTEEDAKLSFTVPGIGGVGGGAQDNQARQTTTTIQVVIEPLDSASATTSAAETAGRAGGNG